MRKNNSKTEPLKSPLFGVQGDRGLFPEREAAHRAGADADDGIEQRHWGKGEFVQPEEFAQQKYDKNTVFERLINKLRSLRR